MGRIGGALEIVAGGAFSYLASLTDLGWEKYPIYSVLGLTMLDGLIDLYKGTHHYLSLNIWKSLTNNNETKKYVENLNHAILNRRNEEISFGDL